MDHAAYRWHEVIGFANLTTQDVRSRHNDKLIRKLNDKVVRGHAFITWMVGRHAKLPAQELLRPKPNMHASNRHSSRNPEKRNRVQSR